MHECNELLFSQRLLAALHLRGWIHRRDATSVTGPRPGPPVIHYSHCFLIESLSRALSLNLNSLTQARMIIG
jgi:hypothetical protein